MTSRHAPRRLDSSRHAFYRRPMQHVRTESESMKTARRDDDEVMTGESTFAGVRGVSIFRRRWLPQTSSRAVLVLSHGMSEHSARYDRLGRFLAARGVAVHALDHRGHGRSGGET